MEIIETHVSGGVNRIRKYLFRLHDGNKAEATFVECKDRYIICFSPEAGYSIGCSFCRKTYDDGRYRALKKEEMIEQCKLVMSCAGVNSNYKPIIFACMGVGEPLVSGITYRRAVGALKSLGGQRAHTRLILSTVARNPALLEQIAEEFWTAPLTVQISLHGATDKVRNRLLPLTASLEDIVRSVRILQERRPDIAVEWNYMLVDGENDDLDAPRILADVLPKGSCIKLNAYNDIKLSFCKPSPEEHVIQFARALGQNGFRVQRYRSGGAGAACGQLCSSYDT